MGIEKLASVRYWSEAEGRAAVAAYEASGLAKEAFEDAHGIKARRIEYWARRLSGTRKAMGAIALAPVRVIASPSRGELAVELRSGRIVRVSGDVDEAQLARVIRVAEGVGC
jgi:hypothetical protein